MRPFILCLCAIAIYAWVPNAEARGRNGGDCSACAGDACDMAKAPAKAWPWSKPTPPPPAPAPAPKPDVCAPSACLPVVETPDKPGEQTTEAILSVEVKEQKHPLLRVLSAPLRLLKAGHERRAERRAARRGE